MKLKVKSENICLFHFEVDCCGNRDVKRKEKKDERK